MKTRGILAIPALAMVVLIAEPALALPESPHDESGACPTLSFNPGWHGWTNALCLDVWRNKGLSRGEKLGRFLLHQDDLYNAAIWAIGYGSLVAWGKPPSRPRWKGGILFDDDLSGTFRRSSSGRETADDVSDRFLDFTVWSPLILDTAVKTWGFDHNPNEAFDMATDWAESVALTGFLTEAVKVLAGRERPFGKECDRNPLADEDCGRDEQRKSFFSGHSSTAAVGAGLTCANAIRRNTWGKSVFQRTAPCALGIGTAITTGILRMSANKHWATDVLVGWTIGGLIGYFDVPGPVDLLRFKFKVRTGGVAAEGMILPVANPGSLGARIAMRF